MTPRCPSSTWEDGSALERQMYCMNLEIGLASQVAFALEKALAKEGITHFVSLKLN